MTGNHILSAAIISVLLVFSGVLPAFAQTLPSQTTQLRQQTVPQNTTTRPQTAQGNTTNTQVQRAQSNTLKDRALREIERRTEKLTAAIERINASTKLSDSAKQQMILSLEAEIETLSDLKTTIETETDEAVVREDVASIRESYNVFAVYMPKVVTLRAAERVLSVADKMSMIKMRLLTQVSTLAASGEDTSELEQTLTDAEESIQAASESAQEAFDSVLALSPEGYPQNRTTFQSARQLLQTARLELVDAQQNLREVHAALQTLSQTPQNSASGEAMMQQPANAQTMELRQDTMGATDSNYVQTQETTLQNPQSVSQPQQVIQ